MSIVNKPAATKTNLGKALTIERIYTTAGVHPYDTVKWERRDVVQTNWKSGEVIFEQKGVEYPEFWSLNTSAAQWALRTASVLLSKLLIALF
jgi:ribonucleoside-diphosphate reductase alpha chain